MTVRELISNLQRFDEDDEVVFAYASGDHWQTVLAGEIDNIDTKECLESSYHNTLRVLEDENDDEDNHKEREMYVVLSSC